VTGTRSTNGLTLVEVLIASVILFSLLTVAVDSYKSSIFASTKARATTQALTALPLVFEKIRWELLTSAGDANLSGGEGEIKGVRYRYSIVSTSVGSPPMDLATDLGAYQNLTRKFTLFDIQLFLYSSSQPIELYYQEVVW
jgi:hypothetical protein